MFKNKRGIELSINFIVMLVLAIAVFIGGLIFASKFFGHAEKVRGSLDSQTERQIEKLLDSGSPVVMPISTKEINKNKFDTFGLGVLASETGEYTMKIDRGTAYDKDKEPLTNDLKLDTPLTFQTIEKHDKGKFLIGVQVPKDSDRGTYLFKVTVYAQFQGSTDKIKYDNPVQFIVRVP
jgi:hypothetical protein